jgi:hypothetical protein
VGVVCGVDLIVQQGDNDPCTQAAGGSGLVLIVCTCVNFSGIFTIKYHMSLMKHGHATEIEYG